LNLANSDDGRRGIISMHARKLRRSLTLVAAISGGGVIAFGALSTALHQERAVGGQASPFSRLGTTITMGAATTTTEPTVLPIEKAVPPVKAKRFGK
jgi:hypothetical protein